MKQSPITSEEEVRTRLQNKTEFERAVLLATYKIPKGKVSTYKEIAKKVGNPRAYRAVANALHKNPLAPIVPCHRVVRSDGRFGGDRREAAHRKKRLHAEGIPIEHDKVQISEAILV